MRSLLLLLAPLASFGAQTAQLTHAAAVHESWSSSSAVKENLAVGASVTTSSHRAGYTHITAPDGKGGWVYSRYLTSGAAPAAAPPAPAPSPGGGGGGSTTTGLAPVSDIAALPKPTLVEANSTTCVNVGSGTAKLDSATNLLKNRISDGSYTAVSFEAMLGLPWQGMKTKRWEWTPDDFTRTRDYEGAAVSVTGYLVAVEPKTGEACNCELSTPDWVDWHIWLVETKAEATNKQKAKAIVVETTPRVRAEFPGRFDLTQVRAWVNDGQKVTVSGWLMLDPDHPSDATGTTKKKASRGTIWEVHPVMKIEVAP